MKEIYIIYSPLWLAICIVVAGWMIYYSQKYRIGDASTMNKYKLSPTHILIKLKLFKYDNRFNYFLLIPYLVIKSRMRLLYKIVINLFLVACMSLAMFFSGSTKEIVMNNGWRGVMAFIITDIAFLCIFFGPSFLFWLSTLPPKRNTAITPKSVVVLAVIFLIFNILYSHIN